ncbi:MAG: DUF4143 domain-containing protein [Clostridiales Family XIII bacterium]|nr:DUF4143 domain-containing protein [Clostridiales Family XIII bacterium]
MRYAKHILYKETSYRDLSSFKLYMGDVGLLTMKSGISQATVLPVGEIDNTFLGALSENYVAQTLRSKGYGLYFENNIKSIPLYAVFCI